MFMVSHHTLSIIVPPPGSNPSGLGAPIGWSTGLCLIAALLLPLPSSADGPSTPTPELTAPTDGASPDSDEATSSPDMSDESALTPEEEAVQQVRAAFPEELRPVGLPTLEESEALLVARAVGEEGDPEGESAALEAFLITFPDSPWTVPLKIELARMHRVHGRFTEAIHLLYAAWDEGTLQESDEAEPAVTAGLGELLRLLTGLGRMEEAQILLDEALDRPLAGPGAQRIVSANEALYVMHADPGVSFRCGSYALENVADVLGVTTEVDGERLSERYPSPMVGFSLGELRDIAAAEGIAVRAVKRVREDAPLIVPSVVHWRLGHYAAVQEAYDTNTDTGTKSSADTGTDTSTDSTQAGDHSGAYRVVDPTFDLPGNQLKMAGADLDAETDGYFLVPGSQVPDGYREATPEELETVRGSGLTAQFDDASPQDAPGSCPVGMCEHTLAVATAAVFLRDIPLPPLNTGLGPDISIGLTYNHRSTLSFPGMRDGWGLSVQQVVVESPTYNGQGATLTIRSGDGSAETFAYNATQSAYVSSSDKYRRMGCYTDTGTNLRWCEIEHGDGSRDRYTQRQYCGGDYYCYLSHRFDPKGHAVTVSYDSSHRVTGVVSAANQGFTFRYHVTTGLLTSISDPYAVLNQNGTWTRTATFNYATVTDGSHSAYVLDRITDTAGFISSFGYGYSSGYQTFFIEDLYTPYKRISFDLNETGNARDLTAYHYDVNNQGGGYIARERVYAPHETPAYFSSDPYPPAGTGYANSGLQYRNSFYWNTSTSEQCGIVSLDCATVYHFLKRSRDIRTTVLESLRRPDVTSYGVRTWFKYEGQSSGLWIGSSNRPTAWTTVHDADGDDPGTALDEASWAQTYHAHSGNITSTTDPLGRVTTYEYAEPSGIDLKAIKINGLYVYEAGYDYINGPPHTPVWVRHGSRPRIDLQYDSYMQLQTASYPELVNGQTVTRTFTLSHNNSGYLWYIDYPTPSSGPSKREWFVFDKGLLKGWTDSDAIPGQLYDLEYSYDALNRVTKLEYTDGTYEEYFYDRLHLWKSCDRNLKCIEYTVDPHRQVTKIKSPGPEARVIKQVWKGSTGLLKELINGDDGQVQNSTKFGYDYRGNLFKLTYNSQAGVTDTEELFIDRLDRLYQRKLRDGQLVGYTVDVAHQLKKKSYPTGSGMTDVTFVPSTIYPDRLESMTDGLGTRTFLYEPATSDSHIDPYRRIEEQVQLTGATTPAYTVVHGYDSLKRRSKLTAQGSASDVVFDLLFDEIGRLKQLTNPLGSAITTYTGGRFDPLQVTGPVSGTKTDFGYDANRRFNLVKHSAGSSVLAQFDYTHQVNGTVDYWKRTWNPPSSSPVVQTWTMAHDGSEYLDSLTEGSSTPFDYGYDERGNLRTRVVAAASPSHTTYHVNDKDQITGIDVGNGSSVTQSYAVSYDARYNVQSDGKCSYVYDLEDLPTSVTCGTTTTTVPRDGFGRPARVIATGGETKDVWLVWDNDRVVQERSGSNPSATLRTWYPNGYTDHSSSTSGQLLHDHLGSVVGGVNGSGVLEASFSYDPQGVRTQLSGSSSVATLAIGYTGHYRVSDLWLSPSRLYSPWLGRWTSPNPRGFIDGPNLYAYVGNDPVSRLDPTGHDWIYRQSTGELSHQPTDEQGGGPPEPIATGYAGRGEGLNNPDRQAEQGVGPIPQGTYDIGEPRNGRNTGPATMNLDPVEETNTFGRDLFRIHGDNARGDRSASEGCVILPRGVRDDIGNSNDNRLRVET